MAEVFEHDLTEYTAAVHWSRFTKMKTAAALLFSREM